ncbi:hypothetical protein [Vibrio lentus]|uniref:hypothetical protein n=1 Tax=Vibrio lentus TaxID=136468 RepID=UPI001056B7F2|nr:hypothetical protein [Vibrio lentus]
MKACVLLAFSSFFYGLYSLRNLIINCSFINKRSWKYSSSINKIIIIMLTTLAISDSFAKGSILSVGSTSLCNVVAGGWKDKKNFGVAGYEYCLLGTSYTEVVNLTQTPIYVADKYNFYGIIKVEGGSKLSLRYPARGVHIVSESDMAYYRVQTKLVVSDIQNAKSTSNKYRSIVTNLPYTSGEKVSKFLVDTVTFEAPLYIGSINDVYGEASKTGGYAVVGSVIGGALEGWDSKEACRGDILRSAFIGGVTGAAGLAMAVTYPTGAGIIISAIATAALDKSVRALCSQCHVSTCNSDAGRF